MENLMRIKQASEYLGVHPATLRRWEDDGLIIPVRIGVRGDRRYNKTMLINLIEKYNNR